MIWFERRSGWIRRADDARDDGDVDYARVIHSAAFRRLQGKTQILNLGDSDFYRTRLTHSLEVAQIAGGLAKQLKKSFPDNAGRVHIAGRSMIQAISCTHDLGHPPFGHGGEIALNYCMRDHGGFEGNGQTLRILSRLENFSKDSGADLTRRTLLGVLKYPVPFSIACNPAVAPSLVEGTQTIRVIDSQKSKPPKCFLDSETDIVDWIMSPLSSEDRRNFQEISAERSGHHKSVHKSFDCSLMDVADDIAYGVHDLEDTIALGLITQSSFRSAVTERECSCFLDTMKSSADGENDIYEKMIANLFGDSNARKHYISRLVYHFISAVGIVELPAFDEPLLRFRVEMAAPQRAFLNGLKKLVYDAVIMSPNVQHLEFKGQTMVVSVFEALQSAPERLLPRDFHASFAAANADPRVICDYVAGMTDSHLLKTYERLFSPRMGSVFDQL